MDRFRTMMFRVMPFRHVLVALICCAYIVDSEALSVAEIDARSADIASRYRDDDPERARIESRYAQAKEFLIAAERHAAAAAEFEQVVATAAARQSELARDLDEQKATSQKNPVSPRETRLALDALTQVRDETESQRAVLRAQLDELEGRERALQAEPAKLRDERDAVAQRLAALENGTDRSKSTDGEDLKAAEVAVAAAEKIARQAALYRLDQQQLSNPVRLDLVRLERDAVVLKLEYFNRRSAQLEELLLEARRTSAESVIEQSTTPLAITADEPKVLIAADRNAALGRELSSIIERQAKTVALKTQFEQQRTALAREFERTRERLRYAGFGLGVGHLLLDQRRHLPNLRLLEQQARARQRIVSQAGLRGLEISDLLAQLAQDDPQRDGGSDLDSAAYAEVLETRRNLLDSLSRNYTSYLTALGDTEYESQRLRSVVRDYRDYLDTKLTWLPNAPRLGSSVFVDARDALYWLFSAKNLRVLMVDLRAGISQAGGRAYALAFVIAALLAVRKRCMLYLLTVARKVRHPRTDRFRYTLGAFGVSLLLAAPFALIFVLLAFLLRGSHDASLYSLAIGEALYLLAPITFLFDWLRRVLGENGIAEQHFRWRDWLTADVRLATTRLVMVLLPSYFLSVFFEYQDNATFQYSLGRLAFIVAMLAITAFIYRLVHPDGFTVRHFLLRYPDSILARLHIPIRIVAIILPLSFIGLALVGYYYTAVNLSRYLFQTSVLVVVAIFAHSLAIRGLLVAETRLALRRAREQRAADATGVETTPQPAGEEEPRIDIATINSQARMLLSNAVGWSVAIALYFIWQGALPAFGALDGISLWEIAIPSDTGTVYQQVTMATLALALIIFATTLIAAKNLPGVLEIAVLQRLPLRPGSRYAITTLAQYIITAVGIIIAFGALGLRWSQIQWLVAALSVGLGFGLQEIVANFISGIILLFERPIRVGDTVTIGDLTGKVARIRIRATTIVDWDNKEIVVPNKNFITDRFVNWTLSDPIIRVKVPVGIAYGSDVTKALEIMTEVARAQNAVLTEPAPRALFLGFGNSSLDFEIQVYIRDMVERLQVVHEMHVAINARFKQDGVEIPFPQRDLHLRSISPAARDALHGGDQGPAPDGVV